jgi:DNA-binding NarL/FixJ family response regulator
VQTHVSHIMTKTGVRSRVEIASAMQAGGAQNIGRSADVSGAPGS